MKTGNKAEEKCPFIGFDLDYQLEKIYRIDIAMVMSYAESSGEENLTKEIRNND